MKRVRVLSLFERDHYAHAERKRQEDLLACPLNPPMEVNNGMGVTILRTQSDFIAWQAGIRLNSELQDDD